MNQWPTKQTTKSIITHKGLFLGPASLSDVSIAQALPRSFELSKNKHQCKYKAKYESNIIEQGTLGRPTSFYFFHFCKYLWCLKSEMRTHSSYSPTCVVLLLKPRHQKIGRKEFQGFFTSLTGTTDNITSSWNNSTITFQEINFACPFSWTM